MASEIITTEQHYHSLLDEISTTYTVAQKQVVKAVNTTMLQTYWQIGQHIVEFEQGGKVKAKYGKGFIEQLSKDLFCYMARGLA